jgi:uncharacterized protein (DUF433 family)
MVESISKNEIDLRLAKGRSLLEAETPDVALLVVWPALEAAMRLVAGISRPEAALLSPTIISSYLFSRSLLSYEDYKYILTCSQQRNAVAHGFRQQVTKEDVERLLPVVGHLLTHETDLAGQVQRQRVREIVGGEEYEYIPLGQYIVKAVRVCDERPTFKYTRIEVAGVLSRLTYGESFEEVIGDYEGRVSREALQEAIEVNIAAGILDDLSALHDSVEAA